MSDMKMITCNWCFKEGPVQTIEEKLWNFWKIISYEDPIMAPHRNICERCKSRYKDFSIYIERCKINESLIDEILSGRNVKNEPSIDIQCHPLVKEEILTEHSDANHATASRVVFEHHILPGCSSFPVEPKKFTSNEKVLALGKIKEEPTVDIENVRSIKKDAWREGTSDSHSHAAYSQAGQSGLGLKHVLTCEVVPGCMIPQKKADTNLICSYCDKTFNYPAQLKIHLSTHTGEKPFKCSLCNKTFTRSSHLKTHLRSHTGEKPFKCSCCNKSFTVLSTLTTHLQCHTGEKPYKCSHCSKTFSLSCHLKVHLRCHTGEKPFKCSHCSKTFTQSNNLKTHLHCHTGERPFRCSHCSKTFTQAFNLKTHLHCHTGEKPFKCLHCSKTFTQSKNLKAHLHTHTGEKPFKCSHCDKAFNRSDSLKKHFLRIHARDISF